MSPNLPPELSGSGRLIQTVNALIKLVGALRQASSADSLTSYTTKGVIRRPLTVEAPSGAGKCCTPRWS